VFGFIKWTIIFGLALTLWCSYSLYSSLTTEEQTQLRKELAVAIDTEDATQFKRELKAALSKAASQKMNALFGY
jgi:hypothetical protein